MIITFSGIEQERLDKFLVSLGLNNLSSRTKIEKLIKNGNIKVNEKSVKKSTLLKNNDKIYIEIPKQKDTVLTRQILENVLENQAFISGRNYLITSNTHFTIEEQHGKHRRAIKNQDIGTIIVPCLVDITYRTYSAYTEGTPFHGDRELLSVDIIHAISKRKAQYRRSLRK